jgi:hypothetical protein
MGGDTQLKRDPHVQKSMWKNLEELGRHGLVKETAVLYFMCSCLQRKLPLGLFNMGQCNASRCNKGFVRHCAVLQSNYILTRRTLASKPNNFQGEKVIKSAIFPNLLRVPSQVLKIVTATANHNLMLAVVGGHNPVLAKLPNARRIHPKIEIWRGTDDKEGDFLAPHEQPITGVFTRTFLSYLVNYDEVLNDLRRRPTTDEPAAPPYSPPFNLDAFNEVFAVMQVYEQELKLPIYKELLANLKLRPVFIIECQNSKNFNDGFFIVRFADYAVRPVSCSSYFLRMTVTCLLKPVGGSLSIEVHRLECPCCTASIKTCLAECVSQSAPVEFPAMDCCCQIALIRKCVSEYSYQMPVVRMLLSKCSGYNAPAEIHTPFCCAETHLSECACQNTLVVVFIDLRISGPTSALILHYLIRCCNMSSHCLFGNRRITLNNVPVSLFYI